MMFIMPIRLAHLRFVIAALLIALTIIPARAQDDDAQPRPVVPESLNLQPTFVEGRVSRYELWSSRQRSATLTVQGNSRDIPTSTFQTEGEATWKIERVNSDGSALCTMTLDWMKATLSAGENPAITVDTRQLTGENARLEDLLSAIAGAPLSVTVKADGTVEKVEGVNAIQQRAGEEISAPDELDFVETATELAGIAAARADMRVNDEWRTQQNWNHSLELGPVEAKMRHDMTYRVASLELIAGIPVVTVEGKAELRLNVDRASIPADGPNVDVQLKEGSFATQIMFDLSRREAVGRNTVQRTVVESTLSQGGRSLGQTISESVQSQVLRIAEE